VVEELYFLGAHPATFAFEIGDASLRKEKSTNVDLSLKYSEGALRAHTSFPKSFAPPPGRSLVLGVRAAI
jgi:hypothetical protein